MEDIKTHTRRQLRGLSGGKCRTGNALKSEGVTMTLTQSAILRSATISVS